jgi:hypothetical protein
MIDNPDNLPVIDLRDGPPWSEETTALLERIAGGDETVNCLVIRDNTPTPIRTFSGTHDFDPTVLADTDAPEQGNADEILWDIWHGICPRCTGPLPAMPEYPAGSRITHCRTIPICGRCGTDEAYEQHDATMGLGYGLSSAGCWPVERTRIDERRERYMSQATLAVIDVNSITSPRNTAGRAQYGKAIE